MDSIERGQAAHEACLHWYERALRYREPAGDDDSLEWQIHYHIGEEYSGDFRYEDACDAVERSVALHPGIYGPFELVERFFPLELLSDCLVKAGRLENGIHELQKHLSLLSGAERDVRERELQLESQHLESDDPRLSEPPILLKLCAEHETKSRRRLVELMINRDDAATESSD